MQPRETYELTSNFENNILADAATGVVQWGAASVIDLGSTIWNSIVPEQYERSTYDNIASFSDDLAGFYEDNKSAVELGSFVGGLVVPGLIVAKAAKAAATGAGFFGKMGKMGTLAYSEDKIQKYTKVAAEMAGKANADTALIRSATWKQRLWTVEKNVAENVMYEMAFAGMMNDHAYMDNYGVDTFLAGVALGSAITTPIGLAIANKSLKDAKAVIQTQNMVKADLGKRMPKNLTAVAGAENPGYALALAWSSEDYLMKAANGINVADNADMHTLLRETANAQNGRVKDIAASLLADPAKARSNITRPKGDTTPLKWYEINPNEDLTPLQMIGYLTASKPHALDTAQRGSFDIAQESLKNIGDVFSPKSLVPALRRDDIGDLGNKGRTYDEAIAYLGGDAFTENDKILHMYMWGGNVETASAVEGRLLRRAGDEKRAIDTAFSFDSKSKITYDPVKQSVAEADGLFLDGARGIRKHPALSNNFVADWLDIPRLQAIQNAGLSANIKVPGMSGPVKVDAASMPKILSAAKLHWIQELHINKYDPRQISIKTNTPMDTVDAALHASGNPAAEDILLKDATIDWTVYKDITDEGIAKAMEPTMHVGAIDPTQAKPWLKGLAYDNDLMVNAVRTAVEQTVQVSRSSMFRSIWDGTANTAISRTLEAELHNLYVTAKGGSIATSADMQLREFGRLNDIIVHMGDVAETAIRTEGMDKIVGKIQPLMERVVTDGRAAIINFEYMRNALDAIPSGQGIAKNLKFDKLTGKIITRVNPKDPNDITYLKIPGTNEDWVSQYDSISSLMESGVDFAGKELWAMQETNGLLLNTASEGQRGIYIPPNNPSGEFVAFVLNKTNPQDIQQISGRNKLELEQRIADITPSLGKDYELITRHAMEDTWNKMHDFAAMNSLREADISMTKRGIPSHAVTGNASVFDDILKGYQAQIYKQARIFNRAANGNIFAGLESLNNHFSGLAKSSKGTGAQKVQMASSPALTASKTLLNVSRVGESYTMSVANNATDVFMGVARDKIHAGTRALRDVAGTDKKALEAAYKDTMAELAAKNLPNPFKDIGEFIQSTLPQGEKQAEETIAAGSQIMSTLNLRLADTAHAIVTTLSAPALIASEAAAMGASPYKSIMNVGKYFFNPKAHPEMQAIRDTMHDKKYAVRVTSEVTGMMRKLSAKQSFLDHLADLDTMKVKDVGKKFKDDPSWAGFGDTVYKMLTKPSDFSEEITREFAYLTGYDISKTRFPGSAKSVHEASANLFAKRAMGNYSARQRSVLFQGSFGQAMGLYQTFMMTIGQNMLRHVENKNLKPIGAFFGAYTPMFGVEALPLYADINTFTGNWLSAPDHQDITQTVYEAFGNKYSGHERSVGEYLLYGAPSALFQSAWYTRGDLDPRVPIDKGRLAPPILVGLADIYNATTSTASNMYNLMQVGAPMLDVGRAMAEGMTIQSMWRPAARLTELGLGYSIDRKGEVISHTEEVRNPFTAVMARVSGARPLKEAILRQQRYYDRAYDTTDTQRRRKYTRALRTHLLADDTSSSAVGNMMQGYLESGGTPTGWGAVLNKTYLTTTVPMSKRLESEVKQQEGILAIIEGYGD